MPRPKRTKVASSATIAKARAVQPAAAATVPKTTTKAALSSRATKPGGATKSAPTEPDATAVKRRTSTRRTSRKGEELELSAAALDDDKENRAQTAAAAVGAKLADEDVSKVAVTAPEPTNNTRTTRKRKSVEQQSVDGSKKRKSTDAAQDKPEGSRVSQSRFISASSSSLNKVNAQTNTVEVPASTDEPIRSTSTRPQGRRVPSRATTPMGRGRSAIPDSQDIDSDLYGLSPGGEISRQKIGTAVASASTSRVQTSTLQPISRRTSFSRPASVLKAMGTPGHDASSVFALKGFRRRKRQGSIIKQMQESSMIDTGLQTGDEDDGTMADFDLDDGLNLDDSFAPEMESTPLHVANKRLLASAMQPHAKKLELKERRVSRRKIQQPEVVQVSRSPSPMSSPPASLHAPSDMEDSDNELPVAQNNNDVIVPATNPDDLDREPLSDMDGPPLSSSQIFSPPSTLR